MDANDYILILRNEILYRARVGSLSSVIGFVSAKNECVENIEDFTAYMEDAVTNFSDNHYSKTDMKLDFCTISSINGLVDNATYALTSDAIARANSLSSKSDLDAWYLRQLEDCAKVFQNEYNNIDNIMNQSPPEEGTMADYAKAPDLESIMEANDGKIDIGNDFG